MILTILSSNFRIVMVITYLKMHIGYTIEEEEEERRRKKLFNTIAIVI
jgi:hypothetical protein